jgi:RHS repeat-associated protein
MPRQSATPTHRTRTNLRVRKCHRAKSHLSRTANRLAAMTLGAVDTSPTTRYVHNALGQRLFKTEPQFPPAAGDENDPAFMASLIAFFTNLWGGNTGAANPSASEKLGFQYFYDEDGSLLYELGSGGANSTGSAHYVYLPTPSGPMPVAFYNGSKHYAVQTDHLNTPRRLTQSDKKVAWQWAFSAFGDEQPTTGKNRYVDPATTPNAGSTTVADVRFNLRYPGQYFDKESGLSYNYFRSYDPRTGRYTQSDPIDLAGGWNKFGYVEGNPLAYTDPEGLRRTRNGHYTQFRPRPRFPIPNQPQASYEKGDPWQDAAGYFDDEGQFVCLRWKCQGNATCYPNPYDYRGQYRSATDFLPSATDPASPPEGCVCDAPRFKLKDEPNLWDWKDYSDYIGKARRRFGGK